MKKLLLTGILGMTCMCTVIAAPNTQPITAKLDVVCVSASDLLGTLKEYAEIPLARGATIRGDSVHVMVLYINPVTKSWTLVEKPTDNLYCVLGVGGSFEPVPEESRKELQKNHELKQL